MALYLGNNKAARCPVTDVSYQPHYINISQMTDFSHFFRGGARRNLLTSRKIDTSNCTNFTSMFQDCTTLASVPQLDTSNGTHWAYTFSDCKNLTSISITTSKADLHLNTFENCNNLRNLDIGQGWNVSIYLHYSLRLTQECLHKMIENLADLTGQTQKNFRIGTTNIEKIDAEHIAMLDSKNWNYY